MMLLVGWKISNRHIKNLYLHSCGKKVSVDLYTFFSMWRVQKTIDIGNIKGLKPVYFPGRSDAIIMQLDYAY